MQFCKICLKAGRTLYIFYLAHLRVSSNPHASVSSVFSCALTKTFPASSCHVSSYSTCTLIHTHTCTYSNIHQACTHSHIPYTLCTFTSINYEICTKKLQLLSHLCYIPAGSQPRPAKLAFSLFVLLINNPSELCICVCMSVCMCMCAMHMYML